MPHFHDTYPVWLAGFIVLSGLALALKDNKKKLILNLLLVFATLFVIGSVYENFEGRKGSNAPYMEADKAELALRLLSSFVALDRKIEAMAGSNKQIEDQVKKIKNDFYVQAQNSMDKALKAAPDSATLHAKEAILLAEFDKPFKKELESLERIANAETTKGNEKNSDANAVTKGKGESKDEWSIPGLVKPTGDGTEPAKIDEKTRDKAKALISVVKTIYVERKTNEADIPELKKNLEKYVPPGWYRDVLNVQLEKCAGHKKEFENRTTEFFNKYERYLYRLAFYAVLIIIASLGGMIVIFAQVFFLSRTPTDEQERKLVVSPGNWGWKAVYGVFISWLSVEFLVSPLLKGVTSQLATIASESGALAVGFLLAGLYLLQNLPALGFMWFFVLRTHGVKFLEGMKIRARVGKTGPARLVLSGILTWLAAIPIIIVASIITAHLGSTGSGNPVVVIVLSAAKDSNFLSTIMFIITLGVLPALCEETLFRGFLYTSLRRTMGAFPAMLVSGGIFSMAHMDMGGAVQLFILGCLFAFILEKTRSLIPSMVAHCMWNSVSFITALTIFG